MLMPTSLKTRCRGLTYSAFVMGLNAVKTGKRVYTSIPWVASVVAQNALGRGDPLTVDLQQVADVVMFDPPAAVARGAVRGGAVGALALISYCSYKCAINELCER